MSRILNELQKNEREAPRPPHESPRPTPLHKAPGEVCARRALGLLSMRSAPRSPKSVRPGVRPLPAQPPWRRSGCRIGPPGCARSHAWCSLASSGPGRRLVRLFVLPYTPTAGSQGKRRGTDRRRAPAQRARLFMREGWGGPRRPRPQPESPSPLRARTLQAPLT